MWICFCFAWFSIICEVIDGSESVFEDNIKLRQLIREKEEKLSKCSKSNFWYIYFFLRWVGSKLRFWPPPGLHLWGSHTKRILWMHGTYPSSRQNFYIWVWGSRRKFCIFLKFSNVINTTNESYKIAYMTDVWAILGSGQRSFH